MEAPLGPSYLSSQSAPAQPAGVTYPTVSFPYDPVKEGVYSSPDTYPANSSPTPDMSSVASWNTAPRWDPAEESTVGSRTSQPILDTGLPPPYFQAGELENYEENVEHGNAERETEELSFMPPPPYPGPGFQAGELSHYKAIYEDGNEERETETQGFLPPPYVRAPQEAEELAAPVTSEEAPVLPVPQTLGAMRSDQYYGFLTGQFPPGTVSHFQSDYETGRDHWGEVHYERYHFPQYPTIPTQTQVPSDELWQQAQEYTAT